jgi:hypothetical protein
MEGCETNTSSIRIKYRSPSSPQLWLHIRITWSTLENPSVLEVVAHTLIPATQEVETER